MNGSSSPGLGGNSFWGGLWLGLGTESILFRHDEIASKVLSIDKFLVIQYPIFSLGIEIPKE